MRIAPARELAVRRLAEVRGRGALANLPDEELEPLTRRDRALATSIVHGTTKWRRRIDSLLSAHCRENALEHANLKVLCALEAAIYEIHWLQKQPRVAVSQYVAVAKACGGKKAGCFSNGVLRACIRTLQSSGWPPPTGKSHADNLGLLYSMPTALVESWVRSFGPREAEKLLQASNKDPSYGIRPSAKSVHNCPKGLRALRQQLSGLGLNVRKSKYFGNMLRIEGSSSPLRSYLRSGSLVLQDEAAAGVVHFMQPQRGDKIADIASAPGGKTTLAAELAGKKGTVTAFDVSEERLARVRDAVVKSGMERRVMCHCRDARKLPEDSAYRDAFDCVLVDVPCSGRGVLAKRTDLRWRKTGDEELEELTKLQRELLDAGAKLVKPGGVLVYSTCSIEYKENQGVALAFYQRNKRWFELSDARLRAPSNDLVDESGFFYQCLPHKTQTDGAFATRFVKRKKKK